MLEVPCQRKPNPCTLEHPNANGDHQFTGTWKLSSFHRLHENVF